MNQLLLSLDPALVNLLVLIWAWAVARAARLPYAPNARAMSRRTRGVLALLAIGVVLAATRLGVVVALGQSGWWFVQEKVVLALPLLLVPVGAVLVLTVPRLLRLWRAARVFPDVVPPSLRQEAAHPLLAWPMQLTALGAVAGMVVLFFVSYPATLGSSFAVAAGVGLAAFSCWTYQRSRHARLSGDVVFPSRSAQLARAALVVGIVAGLAVAGPMTALALAAPGPVDDMGHSTVDLGGGPMPVHGSGRSIGVDELRGRVGEDQTIRRFTLTAAHADLTDEDGSTVDALTFNGTVPGPELRVHEGDLVEVTLHNADIAEGVTIHWHGYDVPNGEDGVAGVTQDAVPVGGSFTYRFPAKQAGTYWYHSHQHSGEQVAAGLFGFLIVEPSTVEETADVALAAHDLAKHEPVTLAAGTTTRLRLVNASNSPASVGLTGVAAKLVAIDGTAVNNPASVNDPGLRLAAGGRVDFVFTVPAAGVRLDLGGERVVLGWEGGVIPASAGPNHEIDLLRYGTPAPTPFGAGSRFDRQFTLVLDQKVARHDGSPTFAYTVNGNAFPEIPTQLVRYGELVKFTIVGRGFESHPIHPHGHHVLVLSRNGVAATGSPLWMDTFDVQPGEVWEVALAADNPGIWMDHCHNLRHAAEGMVFHLAYEGITTPYRVSGLNHPE